MKPVRLNPKESYEQERFVAWCDHIGVDPDAYAAIPNGELRDKVTAAKLERQGVTPGAFDIVFFTMPPIGLEMKRRRGGRLSDAQIRIHAAALRRGWDVIVAEGFEAAKKALLSRQQFRGLVATSK